MKAKLINEDRIDKILRSKIKVDDNFQKTIKIRKPFSITFYNADDYYNLSLILYKNKIDYEVSEPKDEVDKPYTHPKTVDIKKRQHKILSNDRYKTNDYLKPSRPMTETLRFSDGIEIDTSGELRPLELVDGWYVVGEGKLIPVDNEEEAKKIIQKLSY